MTPAALDDSMSSIYERELKGILEGDSACVARVSKTSGVIAADAYAKAAHHPFMVVRAAGSLGVDLVALRGDVSFPIEVKSSVNPTLHFSESNGKRAKQAEVFGAAASRTNVLPVYAYRLKNVRNDDPWRIFVLPAEGLTGRPGVLYSRLPKVATTAAGVPVMRWNDGMPLNKFLEYLTHAVQ